MRITFLMGVWKGKLTAWAWESCVTIDRVSIAVPSVAASVVGGSPRGGLKGIGGEDPLDKKWLPHVAVALAYAAGFALLRSVSFSHWELIAGFRLSVLLLAPYRYWPALLLGEMGPLAYTALECMDRFGLVWACVFMLPPMAWSMPIAYFCRERLRVISRIEGTVDISHLLICALLVSLICTGRDTLTMALTKLPQDYVLPSYRVLMARWFLGNYLGILTLVPLVMLFRQRWTGLFKRKVVRRVIGGRAWMELLPFLVALLALLFWSLGGASDDARQTLQMLMFVPVVWLSLRRGWQGAAIGGTLASLMVVFLMPSRYDQQTLQAETFLSFAITAMLLLGGRIAILVERGFRESREACLALALAQRNVQLAEAQLRQAAQAMQQVRETVQAGHHSTMVQLRHLLPGIGEREYSRHATEAQEQLYHFADTLYPSNLEKRGISSALREGPVARALDEAGVVYWCDTPETGLEQLSQPLRMALYRLTNESIAQLCRRRSVSNVHVRLRVGSFGGRLWAVLCVDGVSQPERLERVRWDALLPRIMCGSADMGMETIRNRVGIFQGHARSRSMRCAGRQTSRISMIVFEPGSMRKR